VSPGSFSVALPTPFLRLRAGDQSVRMEHHKLHGPTVVHQRPRTSARDGCRVRRDMAGWQRAEHSL